MYGLLESVNTRLQTVMQYTATLLTSRLTDSTTSRKTSSLRYLMPSFLQETALVTAGGGLGAITSLWLSWVMYLHSTSGEERGGGKKERERGGEGGEGRDI